MARVVFVSSTFDQFTQGLEAVEIPASNIFGLARALDRRFPGLGKVIENHASIAVDGEVIQSWTLPLSEDSEVVLFPKVAGGRA